jgi:hypothetical protein
MVVLNHIEHAEEQKKGEDSHGDSRDEKIVVRKKLSHL